MSHLLLSEIFPPRTGGSGRWFWETYRRLPREEYCIAAGEHPQAAAFDRTHDLRVHRLPLTLTAWGLRSIAGIRGYWKALWALRPILRRENIRIIHVGRCLPEGVIALAVKKFFGTPYLCYIHGEDITTARDSREHTWLVKHVLRYARMLIANSRNTAHVLREEWEIEADKVHVLHPGVDTDYFSPAGPEPPIRERMGWNGRAVVLTVGRLQKRKGHDMMIRALPRICQAVPNVLYAIAGDGDELASLKVLAQTEGVADHVQFLGEITDEKLLECYQQCDLFALPNRQFGTDIEGFGMVLLEAQSCGKSVLAGDSGGTAETMRLDQTGRIVDCTEPEPLATAVVESLMDEPRRKQMGQAAREWVVNEFDWSSLSRQAERLFHIIGSPDSRVNAPALSGASA
jgi:phosphatidylinositol alpha-1,6-mannosyltransferase